MLYSYSELEETSTSFTCQPVAGYLITARSRAVLMHLLKASCAVSLLVDPKRNFETHHKFFSASISIHNYFNRTCHRFTFL